VGVRNKKIVFLLLDVCGVLVEGGLCPESGTFICCMSKSGGGFSWCQHHFTYRYFDQHSKPVLQRFAFLVEQGNKKHKKIPPVALYVWFLDPELQEKSSGANLQRHPFLGSDDVSHLDQSHGAGLRQELSIHTSRNKRTDVMTF
jgi:hypothetical protein